MNKIALVTGGSSGIGYSTAMLLKTKGYDVFITGRNPDKVQQAARELEAEPVVADMSNYDDMKRLASLFLSDGVDALINNAGIGSFGLLQDITREAFLEVVDINLWGPLCLMRELLPALKLRKGCITNISSVAGWRGTPGLSLYSGTKAALDAVTRVLAVELAVEGIRVNAVAPGVTDTPIFYTESKHKPEGIPDSVQEAIERIPLKRMGMPEEVAHVIVAQLEATNVTGTVWAVDGGFSAT